MELKSASWRNIPEHNIFTIPRINKHKAQTLASEGIYNIADIPDNFELSDAQDNYVKLIESGKPDINKVAIQDKLDELNFPLNFVDFETYMSALPFVPNTRIFEQVPFQYHYFLLESNGEISEANHVSADIERVREDFLESLLDVLLNNDGSIIAYNIRFEIGILKNLSFKYPEYSNDVESIIGRFWDLENVFRHYKDPGFLGRTSLKNVLPVLVPNMSYDNLDIIEGNRLV